MIQESVFAQTTLDIFLIATSIILSVTIVSLRSLNQRWTGVFGSFLATFGLAMIGVFYLADFLALQVLGSFISQDGAETVHNFLHLELQWMFVAIAVTLVCTGSVLLSMDRKLANDLLRESEQRYRSIVQDQPEMIMRWKPNGIRTWVNEPYCKVFGLGRDEAVGTSFFSQIVDLQKLTKKRDSLTPENPVYTNSHEVRLPNGDIGWQEWVSRGIFDSDGNLTEIQSIGRDVSGRIRTARALQESESRFRRFVENTPDFVWEADRDLCCIYCNQQSRLLYGYEPAEVNGRSLLEFLHPDVAEQARQSFSERLARKTGWRNSLVKLRHRNGTTRYIESSADPILDENGDVTGFRGIDRDRTFQTILIKISTNLVGCEAELVNDRIDDSLAQIGQSYELDCLSIWCLDGDFSLREYHWANEGLADNLPQAAHKSEMPDAHDVVVKEGDAYKVESLNELDADSIDRKFLETAGIKSILGLPLYSEGSVVAFAACATATQERTWPDNVVSELQLLLAKINDARAHAKNTLAVLRRERDLSQSEELANVGSYAFYPTLQAREFPNGWKADFSDKQCALLEVEPDAASIDLFLSRVHERDRARIEKAMNTLVCDGVRFEQEFRFVNPGGQTVHIAGSAEIEFDHLGTLSRIVGSCSDITDRVNREERLMDALKENEALRDRLQEENVQLREEIRSFTEFEQIIGDSSALRASLNLAARAAPTDSTILVLGETGTGKELVAKAIHKLSARSSERLVSINCTALPPNLIESELFGHEKGAFTGASARRAGRFEVADGGTLFLDEIGDLPLELQAKLLRVLEDGGFERLGGNKTIRPDVRLIVATNRNLDQAVKAGKFRADLYYRINTVPIEMPPLRNRKEDIPMLAQHFVDKHRERLGKSVIAISSRMIEFLLNREWPGNVRELEHYIERSLISATGKVLSIGEQPAENDSPAPALQARRPTDLRSVERDHILQVLNDTGWVIDGMRGAAAVLGLAPSTLRSRMKRLGIARRA